MKRKEYQSNDDNDVRIEDTLSVEEEIKGESDSNGGNEMKRRRVTFAPDTFTFSSASSLVINKKIQGLINRLNESNIQSIFKSMEELYKENSQRGTLLLLLCYKFNVMKICALKLELVHVQLIYRHLKKTYILLKYF